MERISGEDLLRQIYTDSNTNFDNKIIDLDKPIFQTDLKNVFYIKFTHCVFKKPLVFRNIINKSLDITLDNCTFESSLEFSDCNLFCLNITRLKQIRDIKISNSTFDTIKVNSYQEELTGKILIRGITIKNTLDFSELKIPKGQLTLNFKNNSDIRIHHPFSLFENSLFEFVNFNDCNFGKDSNFNNLIIKQTGFFSDCEFKKVSFEGTDFGKNTMFNNCKFYSYSGFEECKNLEKTNLKISSCLFTSFPHFNGSEFNHLEISHTTFERKVSFDSLIVNNLKLNQVSFLQGAYFDDIQIKKIDDCDRKTIRTIKQELQKAENRIDFNRFRAYELAAHYEELDWKWNSGFIDKSILFATKISTDFGNSWRKALRFTVIGGFVIYLFLHIIENRNVSIEILNWDNWARLFSGFFRFLLVTDFYNPLETDRIYLTNPFSWALLIFGKIFIAFGIYEMIQSFRKFKA
jgi:hypothetical protein